MTHIVRLSIAEPATDGRLGYFRQQLLESLRTSDLCPDDLEVEADATVSAIRQIVALAKVGRPG